MNPIFTRALAASLLASCALTVWGASSTPPVPPESRLVAVAGAPAPTSQEFKIASAEDLQVTLTDLKVPAPLATATVIVTQGDKLVGNATFSAPASSASFTISQAVGTYTLWVFGTPNSSFSIGTFAACVAPKASPSACIQDASLSGNVNSGGSTSDPTVSTLSQTLTVATAGAYTFTYTDLQFPAALNIAPDVALFQGSTTVQLAIVSGTVINLSPGTYTLLSIARADQTTKAGLYGIEVAASGSAPLLNIAVPVGLMPAATPFDNPSTQSVTLKMTDFAFPGPLASASALLTSGSTAVEQASSTSGPTTQSAPAGGLNLWVYATAGAAPGTYEADVDAGTATLHTTAGASTPAGSTTYAYGFVSPKVDAGTYQAAVTDLKFPSALGSLSFEVAQDGKVLKQSTAAGTVDVTAAAGPVVFLVSAQTPPAGSTSTNGLFDVHLSGNSPQLPYDQTQSVSSGVALFDSQPLTIGVSGNFEASLTDLKVPAAFANLALVVSQGSTVFGKIYGGGSFDFDVTPGTYQLTFVATPASQQQFGLYGTAVVFTPPSITTLTSSASSAATNSTITLTWASANATSCTGSGGSWNGNTTSGTVSLTLTSNTTYTLSCTGPGGTTSKSVSVTATPAPSSGGGGSLDSGSLYTLLAALLIRRRARRR